MQLWSKHNCWISNGKTIIFAYFLLLLRLLSLQTYCIFFCLKFALSPAKLLLLFCYAFSLNFKFFCKKKALSLADRLQNVCKTHILATFGLGGKFTKSIHVFIILKKTLCAQASTNTLLTVCAAAVGMGKPIHKDDCFASLKQNLLCITRQLGGAHDRQG